MDVANTLLPFMPILLLILSVVLMVFVNKKQRKIKPEFLELSGWFNGLDEKEEEVSRIEQQYKDMQHRYKSALKQKTEYQTLLQRHHIGIGTVDDTLYVRETDTSKLQELELVLNTTKETAKILVREKEACKCSLGSNLTVNGKKSEATKLINREIKLRIRCFDNEVKAAIAVVDWHNINRLIDRVKASFHGINSKGKTIQTQIQDRYLNVKLQELTQTYEVQQLNKDIKEREREEARIEREAIREETKIQAALEKAKRERELMELLIAKELKKLADATEEQKALLLQHQEELEALKRREQRAISLAQLTRAGYVYIISNPLSFGDDIIKIGMTRRANPIDRVNELGDASVPDTFNVHGIYYCEDAPTLESTLHKMFEEKRVNRVNMRKEFFNIPPSEVIDRIKEVDIDVTEATEYM